MTELMALKEEKEKKRKEEEELRKKKEEAEKEEMASEGDSIGFKVPSLPSSCAGKQLKLFSTDENFRKHSNILSLANFTLLKC